MVKTYIIETTILLIIVLGILWCLVQAVTDRSKETKKHSGKCPKCKKPLTVGVLSRVSDLADRDIKEMPKGHVPYKSIVPLQEIIAESFGIKSTSSKRVQAMYEDLISEVGNEFEILLDKKIEDIETASNPASAEAVRRVRAGEMNIRPGYDGVFGQVKIFSEQKPAPVARQEKLL